MKWINVKDELPRNLNRNFISCMVCRKTTNQEVFHAIFNPLTKKFQQLSFEKLDNITHWMPLPNRPKL